MGAIKRVSEVIQVLTQCTGQQASLAEKRICTDPNGLKIIAQACGISTTAIAASGMFLVISSVQPEFLAASAVALGINHKTKKYCDALVKYGVPTSITTDGQ